MARFLIVSVNTQMQTLQFWERLAPDAGTARRMILDHVQVTPTLKKLGDPRFFKVVIAYRMDLALDVAELPFGEADLVQLLADSK